MTITQIRYFVVVAQVQNFSKAAETLHISQPALSKSIAKLEEEFGTALFVRRGKTIALSEQGKVFLTNAWKSLRRFDHMLIDMQEQTSGTPMHLTVAAYQADDVFSDYLMAFATLHPEVEIDISNIGSAGREPDINQFDVMLYPDSHRFGKLRSFLFREESYLLAVPVSHPLAARETADLSDLTGQYFVFMKQNSIDVEEAYYLCSGMNLRIKALYLTDMREQHRMIVASGTAMGFVPEGSAGADVSDPAIRVLPVNAQQFKRRIMVCFKRDKHISAAGKLFRSFLMERLGMEQGGRENTAGNENELMSIDEE